MIKTRINNEYKDVIKIFGGGTLQKEIIKVWSREAQEYVYESSVEYTGTLPITINSNDDVLIDYRIYGADGGVGEQTENLIDANKPNVEQIVEVEPGEKYCLSKYRQRGSFGKPGYAIYDENDHLIASDYIAVWMSASFTIPANGKYAIISFGSAYAGIVSFVKGTAPNTDTPYPENYIPYGYKLPMVIYDQNLLADDISQFGNGYIDMGGSVISPDETKKEKYSDYVNIVPNTSYTFAMANGFPGDPLGPWRTIAFYRQNISCIQRYPASYEDASKPSPLTVMSPSDAFFARVSWRSYGSEECPVLVTNRDLPVYIGENQLDAGEYVSYAEQKIYRDVNGTLTPTDPPAPLPEIPTINGETIIDYDGDPKPSQMYVKYRR